MITALLSILFLIVGALSGWIFCERYAQHIMHLYNVEHEFEDLFQNNPHPELFDAEGNLFRGDYTVLNIPPGFDPETESFYIEEPEDEEL